jgi:beta-glucanase (GH16 family)
LRFDGLLKKFVGRRIKVFKVKGFMPFAVALLLTALSGSLSAVEDQHAKRFSKLKTVFFDDFDAPDLDRSKWNVIVTGGTVNAEQQAYVDSPETLRIVHGREAEGARRGALLIQAQYKKGFVTKQGKSFDFISGRMDTRNKAEFTYGRLSARIKMTPGLGFWPAFWALGDGRWPDTGEIDMMENVGPGDWTSQALHGPGHFWKYSVGKPDNPQARHCFLACLWC